MSRARTNWLVLRDPSWWHWAATIPLVAGHIRGVSGSLEVAILLCLVVAAGMWLATRRLLAMPVQVRLAYAALLTVGVAPGMFWIYYLQLAGTVAMVLCGYCPLVRMLTLLPWNRVQSLSGPWFKQLLLSASPGGIFELSAPSVATNAVSCSCSLTLPTPHLRPVSEPALDST
jgi:hypothetical protein